jgi:protein-disulfide isomerase
MPRFMPLALATVFSALLALPAVAADPPKPAGFTDAQKAEITQIIKDVLNKEPEIIINAAQAFQAKQAADADKKMTEAVSKYKEQLFNDAKDPVDGNPKGTITMVEFFDYNCGFCKKVHDPLVELVKTEKDVKLVYKQFPILSDTSKVAARAALAAAKQGKYQEMHNALFAFHGAYDEAAVLDLAAKAGLDKDKLKKDMASPEVEAQLNASLELAGNIGARGTPTFVIEDKVVPGAMSLEEMKKTLAEIRERKKS